MTIENYHIDSSLSHIKMLIQLARIDGVVVQDEINFIKTVANELGFSSEELSGCFEFSEEIGDLSHIPNDEKYEQLYNMIQLMKIDGRLYKEEITYCAKLAENFGYDESVLVELLLKIYSDPHISTDKQSLKATIQKYLK